MNDILEINDIKGENKEKNDAKTKKNNKKNIIRGLAVATAILGITTVGFGIGYGIEKSNADQYRNDLSNVYNSNFYSLLDSVNNLENKLNKTINASSSSFQRKTLLEASKNASEAEIAVSSLPFSQYDIEQTIRMVNQISGYTSTLADKLIEGDLNDEDYQTLNEIQQAVSRLQLELNDLARKLNNGYSILDASGIGNENSNDFSKQFSAFKDNDVEYPSMIYDGPFSDSIVNTKVLGLKGEKVSKTKAIENLQTNFKNIVDAEYENETTGKFETYNYRVKNSENETLFVQMTKINGNILTVSGAGSNGIKQIDEETAKQIALDFAAENGIEDARIVWQDTIENDIYFNITPAQNGIILYPDLVKVKINMVGGTVVGYDATNYFTNHTLRDLKKGDISYSQVSGQVPSNFEIVQNRLVLTPLDYNRELVCIEIEATDGDDTYYFYFNDKTGELENILKVIKTDNGNLLM